MGVERPRYGLDRAGRDLVALRDQVRELADHRCRGVDGLGLAFERENVAAEKDITLEMALERPEHGVFAARELRGDCVVELELLAHRFVLS